MGPPKRKIHNVKYSERKRRYDCFEYRWDGTSGSYYLFNPYTGEVLSNSNPSVQRDALLPYAVDGVVTVPSDRAMNIVIQRQQAIWCAPEKFPSEDAYTVQLLPEGYASRRWGRRPFHGWKGDCEAAATHIAAVIRGGLARLRLRQYYRTRYRSQVDHITGYIYFTDTYGEEEASWTKPILAFPDDIQPLIIPDPDDYMEGKKFSNTNFASGPLIRVEGLNKFDTGRADGDPFLIENPDRAIAYKNYYELEDSMARNERDGLALGESIPWFDGLKVKDLVITEYHLLRTAMVHNDWGQVMTLVRNYPQHYPLHIHAMWVLSKATLPVNAKGFLTKDGERAVDWLVEVINSPMEDYKNSYRIRAMECFLAIISVRAGRLYYIDTDCVPDQGSKRSAAVDEYLRNRFAAFNRFLTQLEMENVYVYERDNPEPITVSQPVEDSLSFVDLTLSCIAVIAHEIELKELLAMTVIEGVIYSIKVCQANPSTMCAGIQLLYNLVYRCEKAQEAILSLLGSTEMFVDMVRFHHIGNDVVMRHLHRLELALEPDGWRGNVEKLIHKEMDEAARIRQQRK